MHHLSEATTFTPDIEKKLRKYFTAIFLETGINTLTMSIEAISKEVFNDTYAIEYLGHVLSCNLNLKISQKDVPNLYPAIHYFKNDDESLSKMRVNIVEKKGFVYTIERKNFTPCTN